MRTAPSACGGQRGSAVVVVLALLLLIVAFLAGNDVTLRSLRRELQIVDERQLQKYQPVSAGSDRDTRAVSPQRGTEGATEAGAPAPQPLVSEPR